MSGSKFFFFCVGLSEDPLYIYIYWSLKFQAIKSVHLKKKIMSVNIILPQKDVYLFRSFICVMLSDFVFARRGERVDLLPNEYLCVSTIQRIANSFWLGPTSFSTKICPEGTKTKYKKKNS